MKEKYANRTYVLTVGFGLCEGSGTESGGGTLEAILLFCSKKIIKFRSTSRSPLLQDQAFYSHSILS